MDSTESRVLKVIDGVMIKELVTHADERGFFREMIRVTDDFFSEGFGQCSHSLVYPGVIKAWHGHREQSQWTYVACGLIQVAIHDCRPDSLTFRKTQELLIGDNQPARIYRLPAGVVHGYRCIGVPAHVFYVTSGTYDPNDELRLSYDDPEIGYNWLERTAIK
jgi:dTDP-4-dehydrorhamnose 3,5-epimerase